jgi:hypothetical protein
MSESTQSARYPSLDPYLVIGFSPKLLKPKTLLPCYKQLAGDLFPRTLPGMVIMQTTLQQSHHPKRGLVQRRLSIKCKPKVGIKVKSASEGRQKRRLLVKV